jgi:hypothetical protein
MSNPLPPLPLRLMRHSIIQPSRLIQLLFWFSGICGLAGCNVGPKYMRPVMPAPPAFKESGPQQAPDGTAWKLAQPQDAAIRGKWWEIYQEP